MKATWNFVKEKVGNVHSTAQMPAFLTKSKRLKDPENVAVSFNNFFLQVTEILNLHQVGKEDAILFLKAPLPENIPGLKIILATETQIHV
jgi:hypothetical protein